MEKALYTVVGLDGKEYRELDLPTVKNWYLNRYINDETLIFDTSKNWRTLKKFTDLSNWQRERAGLPPLPSKNENLPPLQYENRVDRAPLQEDAQKFTAPNPENSRADLFSQKVFDTEFGQTPKTVNGSDSAPQVSEEILFEQDINDSLFEQTGFDMRPATRQEPFKASSDHSNHGSSSPFQLKSAFGGADDARTASSGKSPTSSLPVSRPFQSSKNVGSENQYAKPSRASSIVNHSATNSNRRSSGSRSIKIVGAGLILLIITGIFSTSIIKAVKNKIQLLKIQEYREEGLEKRNKDIPAKMTIPQNWTFLKMPNPLVRSHDVVFAAMDDSGEYTAFFSAVYYEKEQTNFTEQNKLQSTLEISNNMIELIRDQDKGYIKNGLGEKVVVYSAKSSPCTEDRFLDFWSYRCEMTFVTNQGNAAVVFYVTYDSSYLYTLEVWSDGEDMKKLDRNASDLKTRIIAGLAIALSKQNS